MERINFLMIDTSTGTLKIALKINDKTAFFDHADKHKHIENLLPCIQKTIESINCDKNEINHIGVCTGPGSFTGIRIGIATALGISFASNLICFGFSVFDVYKFLLKDNADKIIVPVIDAKKSRFYTSFFKPNENNEYYDISEDEITDKIKALKKEIIFTGEDSNLIDKNKLKNINCAFKYTSGYSSLDLLNFGNSFVLNPSQLKYPHPVYIRKTEAEIEYLKKHNIK